MPWAWGDAITSATDWTSVDFLNKFVSAINERRNALRTPGHPTDQPAFAAGDDVQAVATISPLQVWLGDRLWTTDHFEELGWADPTATYDGAAAWPDVYDRAALRTAAGLNPDRFRRKRPREIASLAATTDTQGNAIANGMVAWLTASPYKLYKRVGGAWVRADPADVPDTLDTESAAPDAIDDTLFPASGSGLIQYGDYIGPWIWTELRAMLNKMLWVSYATEPGIVGISGTNDAFTDTTWADAKTAAEADFATSPADNADPGAYSGGRFGGTYYDAYLHRARAELRLTGVPNALSRSREWYVYAAPSPGAADAPGTFDANGDGVAEGVYKRTLTDGPDAASTSLSYDFPRTNLLAPVPTWVASPAGAAWTYRGYTATDYRLLVKYDGAGGFTYKP